MKQAIIDIGSNSMRLTLYEVNEKNFKILFKEKIMAGLAGYVEGGILSDEGIECAYNGLLDFKGTLESLAIENISVFATASLRNIRNTDKAVQAIKAATGYSVEVISGRDEALYGYCGAMNEVNLSSGTFLDIGGASTEIVSFDNGKPYASASFGVGSLNLYKTCVRKILPGDGSFKRMDEEIKSKLDWGGLLEFKVQSPLICVGGTSRAILKIAGRLFDLTDDELCITRTQFDEIYSVLKRCDKNASDLILKLEPDRIHTIIPGLEIMRHIVKFFEAEEILVSKYGVREGYLCQRVLQTHSEMKNMFTPKTES